MFKVGDRVWCMVNGWGEVTGVYCLCIKVTFSNDKSYLYKENGARFLGSKIRTLFFQEINIPNEALERPRWRAGYGERYYFVNGRGIIISEECLNTQSDKVQYETRNHFRTEKEAKASKFYKVFHEGE